MIVYTDEVQATHTVALYQPRSSRSLPFRDQVSRMYWSVASKRRILSNIAICFRGQATMLPLQCEAAIEQLTMLRRRVSTMEKFLATLEPLATQRLRPYACVSKLGMLDYLLAEAILTIAMFAPICQSISSQRVELHLHIRTLFPRIVSTFEDAVSMLTALMSEERQEVCSDLG